VEKANWEGAKIIMSEYLHDLTSTKLIYLAAQMKKGAILSPMGKEIKYSRLWDEPDHGGLTEWENPQRCFLCGGLDFYRSDKDKTIKETFTDHGYAKAPKNYEVCEACTWALSHRTLRNYSIFASHAVLPKVHWDFKHPSRAEIQQLLLHGFEGNQWLLCIAVSGQKWLHFKTPMNYKPYATEKKGNYAVLLEEQIVPVIPKLFAEWTKKVEEAYALGFNKELILKGGYTSNHIKKIGLKQFEAMEFDFAQWRKHRMFELVVFLAQKEKEEECTTDSTPATNTLE